MAEQKKIILPDGTITTPEEVIRKATKEAIRLLQEVNENYRKEKLAEYGELLENAGVDPQSGKFRDLLNEFAGSIAFRGGPADESIKLIQDRAAKEFYQPPTPQEPEPRVLTDIEKQSASTDKLWASWQAEEKAQQAKQNGKGK